MNYFDTSALIKRLVALRLQSQTGEATRFVASDERLLLAAAAEGLAVIDVRS